MLEFGTSFKKARESLNVSVDKVAEETRISTRFLLAIENEQFELLPGGIFNRGFIRTYAERLGLDPDEAIQLYEKLFRPAESEPIRHEVERVTGKTTKIPVYYVALAGLLVLVVSFYFYTRHNETAAVKATTPAATSAETAEPKPADAPPPPAAATGPLNATPVVEAAAIPVSAPALTVPQVIPVPKPATATVPTTSNGSVVIELEIKEESWFKLTSDGNIVTSEVLSPGTTRRYTATNSMDVSIGNAAGVVLRVNGQAVSSLGRTGQVRNITITPTTSAAALSFR